MKNIFLINQSISYKKNNNILFFLESNLNNEQFLISKKINGNFLIIAGAGTGKTRTLIFRTYYLLSLGIKPKNILILTFTKKACFELKERLKTLYENSTVNIETFHSLAYKILKKFSSNKNFQILTPENFDNLIKKQFKIYNLNEKDIPENIQLLFTKFYYSYHEFDLIKLHFSKKLQKILPIIFNNIKKFKETSNLFTFDDLIFKCCNLFPKISSFFSFNYIMVDEYQDTDIQQVKFLKLLSNSKNIMIFGDDFQSIYSFKGAVVENILKFHLFFKNVETLTLTKNYRSSPEIVSFSNNIQTLFKKYFPKILSTTNSSKEKPTLFIFKTHSNEVEFLFSKIKKIDKNFSIAILFRNFMFMEKFIYIFQKNNMNINILENKYFSSIKDANSNIYFSTIHSSKGLEWDYVFIPCLLDGILPSCLGNNLNIEEEKRLFYVACTRAHFHLFLSYSLTLYNEYGFFNSPSPFLKNLDKNLYNIKQIKKGFL